MADDLLLPVLGAMAVLFGLALACMVRLRAKYAEEASRPLEIHPRDWMEQYAEAAPGIFLILGLFGTFCGLAISIDAAGEALRAGRHGIPDMQRQFSALASSIEGIGLKFLSSLAGIVLHLATRSVYGLLVLPARRLRDRRRAEAEAERLRNTEEARREAAATVAAALAAIQRDLGEVASLPRAIHDDVGELARAAAINRDAMELVQRAMTGAASTVEKIDTSARVMESILGRLKDESAGLSKTMREGADRFATRLEVVSSRFEVAAHKTGETLNEVVARVGGALARHEATLEAMTRANTAASEMLQGAAERSAGTVLSLAEEVAKLRGRVDDFAQGSTSFIQAAEGLVARSADAAERIGASATAMGAVGRQMLETSASLGGSLTDAVSRFENRAEAVGAGFERAAQKTGDALDQSSQRVRAAIDAHEARLSDVTRACVDASAALDRVTRGASQAIDALTREVAVLGGHDARLAQSAGGIAGAAGEIAVRSAEALDRLDASARAIEALGGHLERTSAGLRFALTEVVGRVDVRVEGVGRRLDETAYAFGAGVDRVLQRAQGALDAQTSALAASTRASASTLESASETANRAAADLAERLIALRDQTEALVQRADAIVSTAAAGRAATSAGLERASMERVRNGAPLSDDDARLAAWLAGGAAPASAASPGDSPGAPASSGGIVKT